MKKLSKKALVELKKSATLENRRIKRENQKFEKLDPAEKRVQIARDVLAQLTAKKLVAEEGCWLGSSSGIGTLFSDLDVKNGTELQDILNKTETCTGCALGGLFMCAVKRADELKVSELSKDSKELYELGTADVFRYMKKFFSRGQLNKIEAAFERGEGAIGDQYDAAEWLQDIDDPSERMRLIMENIVANKGTFTLKSEPVLRWTTPGFTG